MRRTETSATSSVDGSNPTYYDLPVIHRAHWKWMIIFYFFLGGISGAAYVIASIAKMFGGREGTTIARTGYYVSFTALLPSPILLILDLKKPSRFLNMLRVVKLRSPMSLGVWILVVFSAFSTLSAAIQSSKDNLLSRPRGLQRTLAALPAGPVGAIGTVPAFLLSGYTGVLLAATAVPLWTRSHLAMGPLFVASAISNASAAITLVLALRSETRETTIKKLERLDSLALMAETGILSYATRNMGPVAARPLQQGHTGKLVTYGFKTLGVATPLLVQTWGSWWGKHPPRAVTVASSALVLAGGFILRYVMVVAGNESADDPHATFEMTRRTGS